MVEPRDVCGAPTVTDRRPAPRGVLPKGIQTWLMAALAIGMLLIILLAGQPESSPGTHPAAPATEATNPDRVREYQERLRALDAQAAQEARSGATQPSSIPPSFDNDAQAPAQADAVAAERRRRQYESLFASNVVLSRRPEAQRPDRGPGTTPRATAGSQGRSDPSIDEIADAVVRATVRSSSAVPEAMPHSGLSAASSPAATQGQPETAASTEPINGARPLHRVPEGTLIDAVLTNRLDGAVAAPVSCLVTNPVYSHSGQHVLVPAGARVLGETRPVQTLGETRLAVVFHRILMPDGSSIALDQFRGLNQIGDSGLRDQVNQHYWSTFGAAGAVGLVSGLAQLLGTTGIGRGEGNRTVVLAESGADATAQASGQVMNRFLNRLPTITVREGHRVKVYVTSDLDLPAYPSTGNAGRSEGR